MKVMRSKVANKRVGIIWMLAFRSIEFAVLTRRVYIKY